MFGKGDSIGELKPSNVPFTLDYFKNATKSDFPWHQILLEREGYDISALYMKWNKSAIRYLIPENIMGRLLCLNQYFINLGYVR